MELKAMKKYVLDKFEKWTKQLLLDQAEAIKVAVKSAKAMKAQVVAALRKTILGQLAEQLETQAYVAPERMTARMKANVAGWLLAQHARISTRALLRSSPHAPPRRARCPRRCLRCLRCPATRPP